LAMCFRLSRTCISSRFKCISIFLRSTANLAQPERGPCAA
jgi:hypothetical protein